MARFELHLGDCLEVLKTMPDNSVDAVVCDPPYGLSFMGRKWDYDVPEVAVWAECLRVLKPGGHLLAFAGTRTQHRMAVRIEDAGFEIRDMIAWVYGSGFPKSLDVSKAIDKAAGAEREVVGRAKGAGTKCPDSFGNGHNAEYGVTLPATDAARQWQGWGTALKPALEPITVARKPFRGTVAENVLAHGTGAINIDGCRVSTAGEAITPSVRDTSACSDGWNRPWMQDKAKDAGRQEKAYAAMQEIGRWPANLIHDGSDEVLAQFPASNGAGGSGSAARFFYCAKASKADRNAGCEHLPLQVAGGMSGRRDGSMGSTTYNNNTHPTVKPTDLMAYLCRLVTPPGGVVLDPFMGSGSTGKAAVREGFRFIGIEREAEYLEIARARISAVAPEVRSVDDLI